MHCCRAVTLELARLSCQRADLDCNLMYAKGWFSVSNVFLQSLKTFLFSQY